MQSSKLNILIIIIITLHLFCGNITISSAQANEKEIIDFKTEGPVTDKDIKLAKGFKWIADNLAHTKIGKVGLDEESNDLMIEYYMPNENDRNWKTMVTISILKTNGLLSERNKLFKSQIITMKKMFDMLHKGKHQAVIYKLSIHESPNNIDITPSTKMALLHYMLGDEVIIGFIMPYGRKIITAQYHKKNKEESFNDIEKGIMLQTYKYLGELSNKEDIRLYETDKRILADNKKAKELKALKEQQNNEDDLNKKDDQE